MFTGIIECVGKITRVEVESAPREQYKEKGLYLTLECPFEDVALGESIALNGVCLTAIGQKPKECCFFVSLETCTRSNLGQATPGMLVNLERAMRLQDRLSGHIVQGHVDGMGKLLSMREIGEAHEIVIQIPKNLLRFVVEKGSITIDGISLTVNSIKDSAICIMIIPHTWENTNLSSKQSGDVNLEVDVIAKYVQRLTSAYNVSAK